MNSLTSIQLGYYLLEKAESDDKKLTPKHIEKLMFFAHEEYLFRTGGEPLIKDNFYAGENGFFTKESYSFFKDKIDKNGYISLQKIPEDEQLKNIPLFSISREVIDQTYNDRKDESEQELIDDIHLYKTWEDIYLNNIDREETNEHFVITKDKILSYREHLERMRKRGGIDAIRAAEEFRVQST